VAYWTEYLITILKLAPVSREYTRKKEQKRKKVSGTFSKELGMLRIQNSVRHPSSKEIGISYYGAGNNSTPGLNYFFY
jgi:hypothetical protein